MKFVVDERNTLYRGKHQKLSVLTPPLPTKHAQQLLSTFVFVCVFVCHCLYCVYAITQSPWTRRSLRSHSIERLH